MNPFVTRMTGNAWVLPVGLFSLILLLMIKMAWLTPGNLPGRIGLLPSDQQNRVRATYADAEEEGKKLEEEIAKLRDEKTKLENAIGSQTKQAEVLNENLQEAKIFAGLTEVEGPGILVTLKDSEKAVQQGLGGGDQIIHDIDVLRVVNELWASGAEAISVNNRRVAYSSSFRCVGPVIHVDGVPISSPVTIRAIGDAPTLMGGLNLPLGVLAEIRSADPAMVQLEGLKTLRLPAYQGATTRKYATVPKDAQ